ncbi:MAG: nucleotide sugar dehydrogenase [Candidatus Methylomirabilales bacterium]
MNSKPDVAIVGMGYVGLTLAVTLADLGFRVWGYDRHPQVVKGLSRSQSHFFEPGLDEVLRAQLGRSLVFDTRLPGNFTGVTIICVSTPVGSGQSPDLSNLRAATESIAESIVDGALVIVRSTVPVGACRNLVLPVLQARHGEVRLSYCPERTIQGQALRELRILPQVVGPLNDASEEMAVQLWKQVTQRVVVVSSLEAAEMVKLINNCHTDLIYSYGNEVAMMAHKLGLDPLELIRAANLDYPRPDLARPGFVAGPCMSKDPYLLMSSLQGYSCMPRLLMTARALNESLPEMVTRHLIESLGKFAGGIEGAKVLICGFAYKGWPVTDDVRGAPAVPIVNVLRQYPVRLYGHDHIVPSETISICGVSPVVELDQGFDGARAVLFVNEHPEYRKLEISKLTQTMQRPAIVYDCWRMFDTGTVESVPDIHYVGIGYG